ncbi:MAG: biotin--[acetyl-CoA-carboxylase] ligase [Deltaproteobacteria bacterium]|nr:biotin--[acetyl-CoA-carboxylase] ligase [Deltaproteobacteria bacterium]
MSSTEQHPGRDLLTAVRIRRGLGTRRLGGRIDVHPELESTNRTARALAEAGEPEGAVVIAEAQTRGQGRLGRHWVSPAHLNLYVSFILRPRLDPAESAKTTLLAAVAVADTLKEQAPCVPRIKWPNDVLLRGRKVAGILSELACEPGRTLFVIVGIGVNLNFPRALMSADIRDRATSVMEELGSAVDRVRFTQSLVRHLENRYIELEERGFAPIADRWNEHARMDGQWVRARMPEEELVGRVRELDGDGFLVLECRDGRTERVVSGDVFLMGGG